MTYTPGIDFVALWRNQSGGAVKAEMPALDFVVAALARAGLINVSFSDAPPTVNQSTTMWFRPVRPTYSGEGTLFAWNGTAYVVATPPLFHSSGGGGGGVSELMFAIVQANNLAINTAGNYEPIPYISAPTTDPYGGWDAASRKFTPKKPGYYVFQLKGAPVGNNGLAIIKNDDGAFQPGTDGNDIIIAASTEPNGSHWHTIVGFAYMNGTSDFVRAWAASAGGMLFATTVNTPAFSALYVS